MRQKQRMRRLMAALLTAAMLVPNAGMMTWANNSKAESGLNTGWYRESYLDGSYGPWMYYEQDGNLRRNGFAKRGEEMYYLGDDGLIVKDQMIHMDDGRSYYIKDTGTMAMNWWYLNEGGKLASVNEENGFWYYFQPGKLSGETWQDKHVGEALKSIWKGISSYNDGSYRMYAFDDEGRMQSETILESLSEDDNYAYAQKGGVLATNKWLFVDGGWRYFKRDSYAATGSNAIRDVSYDFGDDGVLEADQAPYEPVHHVSLALENQGEIRAGTKVVLPLTITTASPSDALPRPITASASDALLKDEVYDVTPRVRSGVLGQISIKLEKSPDGNLQYVFVPKVAGEYAVSVQIDGKSSETVSFHCTIDEEDIGINYIKDILSGILNAENINIHDQINAMKAIPVDMLMEMIEKNIPIDSGDSKLPLTRIIQQLELQYGMSYHMSLKDLLRTTKSVSYILDTSKVSVVGALMNANPGTGTQVNHIGLTMEPAQFQSGRLPADVRSQTLRAIEIRLTGDGIDSGNLAVPVSVTMPVPKGISSKDVRLFHFHGDGSPEEVTFKMEEQSGTAMVTFVLKSFSTFVFAGSSSYGNNGGGGSSGGSGGSGSGGSGGNRYTAPSKSPITETPGNWRQTMEGWQFVRPDGTLYVNTWIYSAGKWYWVNQSGLMAKGWNEINGKRYYMSPVNGDMSIGWIHDNDRWYFAEYSGVIKTGWVLVNEKWYYFDEYGHMLSDAITPDGFRVDGNGEMVNLE